MNVFEFARIVELNRELYREFHPHCPLCGCTNVRWKGCDNPWHSLRTGVRSGNVGVHTGTTRGLLASSPLNGSLEHEAAEGGPMSYPDHTTVVNHPAQSDGGQ